MNDADGKDRAAQRGARASRERTEAAPDGVLDRLRTTALQADLDALALVRHPRLETIGQLGKGGTGKVEAVLDTVLRRTAAKKSLRTRHERNPRSIRRFVREARITSQLDHPSVVPVHDLGLDPSGRLFFTLKLVEGRTLSQILAGWRDHDVEEDALLDVLDGLVKVCDALSLAHARGVVHCDVKPENIMIGDYGETYLMDWGSALVLGDDAARHSPSSIRAVTSAGPSLPGDSRDDTVSGTPNYMAPEQANADIDLIEPRTDVFGMGATLYEVLAGRPPYVEDEEAFTVELAAEGRHAPLEDLVEEESFPPLLGEIVSRAMAKSIEDRYPSVDALKGELVRFIRGGVSFPVSHFEPGTVVVREGDAGDRAYIINRGYCEVIKDLEGERIVVRTLGPGEVFGEAALLSPGPRTASVVAVDAVSAQVLRRDVIARELDSVRPWLSKLLGTVAERFREADAQRHRSAAGDPARSRGRDSPPAVRSPVLHAPRYAAMYLHTFGRALEDGSLEAPWSALRREIERLRGADTVPLHEELQACGSFEVDRAGDTVTLRKPAAFLAALGRS